MKFQEKPPPPLPPHPCDLCKVNMVPWNQVRCGGPVSYVCESCEKIIAEYERRKSIHHKRWLRALKLQREK